MIRLYRLSELRQKYPSSTWVAESDGGWRVVVKNPASADWWRRWVLAPEWGGMRRAGLREGLRLVEVTRPRRAPASTPPVQPPPAPHGANGAAGATEQ